MHGCLPLLSRTSVSRRASSTLSRQSTWHASNTRFSLSITSKHSTDAFCNSLSSRDRTWTGNRKHQCMTGKTAVNCEPFPLSRVERQLEETHGEYQAQLGPTVNTL